MKFLLALIVLAIAIQFIPYGRDHSNPPVVTEPKWDSPRTRELAQRACFDCHSNTTVWPTYAQIAPASWLLQHDVEEGRSHLNFSEWNRPQEHAGDAAKEVREKAMPPAIYLPLHAGARLTDTEREELAAGLQRLRSPAR
jgi:hypothetical protein